MDSFRLLLKKDVLDFSNDDILVWNTIAFTKNIDGQLKKYKFDSYRFADEKEVRYVPTYEDLKRVNESIMMGEKEYKRRKSKLINISLSFKMVDVKYIIMPSSQKIRVMSLFKDDDNSNIIFLSREQIIQDIIGLSHFRKS